MSAHSPLAPSSASRRVACPGSRSLEALYPQTPTPQTLEGEAAHWVAACTIQNSAWEIPAVSPTGVDITDEMIEGAQLYAGFVGYYSDIRIEQPISISIIHPDCWGTPDAWRFSDGVLNIYDYKFGHGFVEVYENWQMIEYAAGILHELGIDGLQDQHVTVAMHIIQPRSFHPDGQIRSWTVKASDLRPYFNYRF